MEQNNIDRISATLTPENIDQFKEDTAAMIVLYGEQQEAIVKYYQPEIDKLTKVHEYTKASKFLYANMKQCAARTFAINRIIDLEEKHNEQS